MAVNKIHSQFSCELEPPVAHRYCSSAKSTRTKHPFDYILASCTRLLDPILDPVEMTHGECLLLTSLTYTRRLLGQPRDVSFGTEMLRWKLIFCNCSQYRWLFSCWPVTKIIVNFNDREIHLGVNIDTVCKRGSCLLHQMVLKYRHNPSAVQFSARWLLYPNRRM